MRSKLALLAALFASAAAAQVPISQLPTASTPLTGSELVPIVQGGVTKNAAVSSLSSGGSVTSVALNPGSTGMLFSGSPITTSGTITLSGVLVAANGGTGVTSSTGSGSVVLSTSPTLVTPNLGTPASAVLTNATGLPLATGVTGTLPVTSGGTGVATSTGSGSVVLSNSPTLVTPVLGTPASGVLTNATGLPLASGVTGVLPVANGGTGDSGTAWTTYTPTVSCGSGTLTSASGFGRYKQLGKTLFINISVSITTNGTCSGSLIASLPIGINSQSLTVVTGRDFSTGNMLQGFSTSSSNTITIIKWDNSYPFGNGSVANVNGVIETQ